MHTKPLIEQHVLGSIPLKCFLIFLLGLFILTYLLLLRQTGWGDFSLLPCWNQDSFKDSVSWGIKEAGFLKIYCSFFPVNYVG